MGCCFLLFSMQDEYFTTAWAGIRLFLCACYCDFCLIIFLTHGKFDLRLSFVTYLYNLLNYKTNTNWYFLVWMQSLNHSIMGRKVGGLHINPKKFGSINKPCLKEMISFLNCVAVNHNNDDPCARQKELLHACMDAQVI